MDINRYDRLQWDVRSYSVSWGVFKASDLLLEGSCKNFLLKLQIWINFLSLSCSWIYSPYHISNFDCHSSSLRLQKEAEGNPSRDPAQRIFCVDSDSACSHPAFSFLFQAPSLSFHREAQDFCPPCRQWGSVCVGTLRGQFPEEILSQEMDFSSLNALAIMGFSMLKMPVLDWIFFPQNVPWNFSDNDWHLALNALLPGTVSSNTSWQINRYNQAEILQL